MNVRGKLETGAEQLFDRAALDTAVAAERERWAKVLGESCDEERSQMWEAAPGGGCSRAIAAEVETERLRTELICSQENAKRWQGLAENANALAASIARSVERFKRLGMREQQWRQR